MFYIPLRFNTRNRLYVIVLWAQSIPFFITVMSIKQVQLYLLALKSIHICIWNAYLVGRKWSINYYTYYYRITINGVFRTQMLFGYLT